MRKIRLLQYAGGAMIFLLILLIGCSDREQYIYKGNSENWEARLKVTVMEEGVTKDFTLNYRGELKDLTDANEIMYEYRTASSSGKSTANFSEEPPSDKSFSHHSGSNRIAFNENQTVDVIVKWGEEEEKIELKNE
ncbi:hypothetical protein [Pontibacillus halophilus]|nr:hypothetical protein [Pontibacillus halophilus]